MDYYKSREVLHGEVERRRRLRRVILFSGITLFILVVAAASVHFWYQTFRSEGSSGTGGADKRVIAAPVKGLGQESASNARPGLWNRLYAAVRGGAPQVQAVVIEKNGNDVMLKPGEPFEVTYRDEFVIKEVVTDALFPGGISARIEGDGTPIGTETLVKGIDLVDRMMKAESEGAHGALRPDYRLIVRYNGKTVEQLPLRVIISPQDWLRTAKNDKTDESLQLSSLKKALELNPRDVEVRRTLAAAYAKKGQFEQAIREYRQILKFKPDDMRSLVEVATLLMEANRHGEALPLYQKIIARNRKDSAAYANAGLAAAKLEKWKEAATYYAESLKIKPNNPEVELRLAEAQHRVGSLDQAAVHYHAYLKRRPNDLDTLAALGDIDMKQKRYGDAVDVFKRALSVKPDDSVLYYNLAAALASAKRNAEAIAAYEKVLKLTPQDYDARIFLADLYAQEKQYTKAAVQYERVLKETGGLSKEKTATVHAGLGYVYGELKDYAKSTIHYKKAVALGSKNPTVAKNLKAVREKSGESEPEKTVSERVTVADKNIQKIAKLAEGYIKQKKYDKAIASYRKMTQLGAGRAEGYVGLGRVYGLQGNAGKEIDNYRIALTVGADKDDKVYYRLGEACERQGRYAEALDAYGAAYERNADSPAAHKIPALKIKMIQQKYDKNASQK